MNSNASVFINRMCDDVLTSSVVRHPYLVSLSEGSLPNLDYALEDFAYQYGVYSSMFPCYLSALIENLQNSGHQSTLLENLMEEQGNLHEVDLPEEIQKSIAGVPHTELYQRFQAALGIDDDYRSTNEISQTALLWSHQFHELCKVDECVGIGAIGIGTELIVSAVYQHILECLTSHTDLTQSQYIFFELHTRCDDGHAEQLISIAKELAQDNSACERIEYGARMALQMRGLFWDKMLERALASGGHERKLTSAV